MASVPRQLAHYSRSKGVLWKVVIGVVVAGVVAATIIERLYPPRGLSIEDLAGHVEQSEAVAAFEFAAEQRDWLGVIRQIPKLMLGNASVATFALTIVSGAFWLAYLVLAGETTRFNSTRMLLCLIGFGLGVFSVGVTFFFIAWQEAVWGIVKSDEPVAGIIFWVAGVGLREELAKLLCFAPLAPWLAKRGHAVEMLIVAGCVGLGFAVTENLGYFAGSAAGDAPGRFLTANFLHIALTGLAGLALCLAIRWPAQRLTDLLIAFPAVVIVHGLYNALIGLPTLADFSIASFILFVLIAYQFFHQYRESRTAYRPPISLTSVLLVGFAVTIAGAIVLHSGIYGVRETLKTLAPGALNVALIAIVFIREVPETWTD